MLSIDLANNTKKWIIKNFTECAIIDTKMVKDFEEYADYPHIGIDSIEKKLEFCQDIEL